MSHSHLGEGPRRVQHLVFSMMRIHHISLQLGNTSGSGGGKPKVGKTSMVKGSSPRNVNDGAIL